MSINGASRILQADNQLKKESQSALNPAFKDENERVKSIKKFPSKNAIEHNHSK